MRALPDSPRRFPFALLLPALLVLAACGGGGTGGDAEPVELGESLDGPSPRALAPVIVTAQGLPARVERTDIVRFRVTVRLRSPDGTDFVRIRLQNPPPGCACAPVSSDTDRATIAGRWDVAPTPGTVVRLSFRLETSAGVFRRTFEVDVLGRAVRAPILVGDVTGDGRLDTVTTATSAGADDRGAVYVFAGDVAPRASPTATLIDPSSAAGDRLGGPVSAFSSRLELVDVTGDGVLDVVAGCPQSDRRAVDAGAILVFAGGPTLLGVVGPTKVLQPKLATASSFLGYGFSVVGGEANQGAGSELLFADVTGDGVRDVIAATAHEARGAVASAGSVRVWAGGSTLGTIGGGSPGEILSDRATLLAPTPVPFDLFGADLPLRAADVTGDGILDVLWKSSGSNGVFVFEGGAALDGQPAPRAFLSTLQPGHAPDPVAFPFADLLTGDVDGDGVEDVLAIVRDATIDGAARAGGAFLWRGGATLAGTPAPSALLSTPIPVADEAAGSRAMLRDVTGDGLLDVLLAAPAAQVDTVPRAGEVRVYRGGPLVSARPTPARLRVPDPLVTLSDGSGLTLAETGDVTGDGIDDLVVVFSRATIDGIVRVGEVLLFAGGVAVGDPALPSPAPLARLRGASLAELGRGGGGVLLEDFDGDGALDVAVASISSDVVDRPATARIECWRGGVGAFAGIEAPDRVLTSPTEGGLPTPLARSGNALFAGDLNGDGRADLVARYEPRGDTSPCAAFYGGATLFTTLLERATFTTGDAEDASTPGEPRRGLSGSPAPLQLLDVTGDGRLDLVGANSRSTTSAGPASGAVYVWNGRATFNAAVVASPSRRILARATGGTRLTERTGGHALLGADLTGDGIPEILIGDPVAGAADDGEIAWVRGGAPPPAGAPTPAFDAGTEADGLTR